MGHLLFLLPPKRKGHPQSDCLTTLSEGILFVKKEIYKASRGHVLNGCGNTESLLYLGYRPFLDIVS